MIKVLSMEQEVDLEVVLVLLPVILLELLIQSSLLQVEWGEKEVAVVLEDGFMEL